MASRSDGMSVCRNIDRIRQQLLFTEKELQNINFLETDIHIQDTASQVPPRPSSQGTAEALSLDDLSPGTPKVTPIKSLPPLTAIASSTPKASRVHRKIGNGKCTFGTINTEGGDSPFPEGVSSLVSEGSHSTHSKGSSKSSYVSMESVKGQDNQTSRQVHREVPGGFLEDENEELRQKLQQMRRTNSELTSTNHELLNQLENLEHQQRQNQHKFHQLSSSLTDKDVQVTQLKEELLQKVEQLHSTHGALQEFEEEKNLLITENKTQAEQLEEQLENFDSLNEHIHVLKTEVANQAKLKERSEYECRRALEAAESMQKSVEDFHKKTQDRIQQYDSAENDLKGELTESNKLQVVLEQRVHNLTTEVTTLQEIIRSTDKESESQRTARIAGEQENVELRTQVAKLTAKLGRLENGSSSNSELKRQNYSLENQVSELKVQLRDSHRDLHDMKVKLDQALACRESMDPSDSGLGFPDSASSIVHELREKLSDREQEITVLKARLSNRDTSGHDSLDNSLRYTQQERRIEELELLIRSLEEERGRYASKFLALEESKTQFEMRNTTLATRLQHWTQQAEELQQELAEVNGKMVANERQLRKSQKQACDLEKEVEEKHTENRQYQILKKNLEKELQGKIDVVEGQQAELERVSTKLSEVNLEKNELQRILSQKSQSTDSELRQLRRSLQEKEEEMQKTLTDMDKVAQDLNAKQMAIADMQHELRLSREEGQRALSNVEQRASHATGQVQELQGALSACRDELQVYMDQMASAKSKHDEILAKKSQEISNLQHEVATCQQTLSEKEARMGELDHQAQARHDLLKHGTQKLTELEEAQGMLQTQVSVMERQLQEERSQWEGERGRLAREAEALQDKLRSASTTLDDSHRHLQEKVTQVQKLQHELSLTKDDNEDLRTQLDEAQADVTQLEDQVAQLEAQLRDTKNNMRNSKNRMENAEEELQDVQAELEEKRQKATDLYSQLQNRAQELRQAKIELESARSQLKAAEGNLHRHQDLLEEREGQLTLVNNKLSTQQETLEHKQQEMEQLCATLQQQQWHLQQRTGQVTQLDVCLKEHQNQMDQRMSNLETSLKKSQLEAQQRTKQVSMLDEQVSLLKDELKEKELQLEETSKACSRQQVQLHSSSENVRSLQQQIQDLKSELLKTKNENRELQKELDATRNEETRLQQELTQAQCESSLSQRQQERINTQLQEALQHCQAQKNNATSLAEALELLNVQKAQLESRHEASKRQVQRELDTIKARYQQQVDNLRTETSKVANSLEGEQHKLNNDLRGAQEQQQHLVAELETTKADLDHRNRDFKSLQDAFQNTNSSLMVKEAEVIRLEARLAELTHQLTLGSSFTNTGQPNGQHFLSDSVRSSKQHYPSYQTSYVLGGDGPTSLQANQKIKLLDSNKNVMPHSHDSSQARETGNHQIRYLDRNGEVSGPKVTFQSDLQTRHEQSDLKQGPGKFVAIGVQDFNKSYPPSGASRKPDSTFNSDLQASNGSHFLSLSISDISRVDNSSARYAISEPEDPDSLQSMLREVQKLTVNDQSVTSQPAEKPLSRVPVGRLFGAGAWPAGKNNSGVSKSAENSLSKPPNSSVTAPQDKKGIPVKKTAKVDSLRKSKGPLHSSPHGRSTKSAFGAGRSRKQTTTVSTYRNTKSTEFSTVSRAPPQKGFAVSTKQATLPKEAAKAYTESPELSEQSPNISTAMAHYGLHDDSLVNELFPEQDRAAPTHHQGRSDDTADSLEEDTVVGGESQDEGDPGITGDGLNLAARRKALQAMQAELESQIHAVDQHLGSN